MSKSDYDGPPRCALTYVVPTKNGPMYRLSLWVNVVMQNTKWDNKELERDVNRLIEKYGRRLKGWATIEVWPVRKHPGYYWSRVLPADKVYDEDWNMRPELPPQPEEVDHLPPGIGDDSDRFEYKELPPEDFGDGYE